jgi:uracil-DNA glycosylase
MEPLEQLKAEVNGCTLCALSQKRTNVVFGEGYPQAKLMCIGEGPGYYEDQMGRPFVGKSGELLDKILGVCGFSRNENVYIANIVKCRPPDNRDPLPEERTTCLPYLLKQIEIIQPKIIVLLGSTALKGLIDPNAKITQVRGTWLTWKEYQVMPTFHPSALLRNEQLKRPAWEDFKSVVAKYRELVNPEHYSAHC